MVQPSKEETHLVILKRIQESISCPICHNLITNPMRNPCGHRFCFYCIINALDPDANISNCPKCDAAIQRKGLVKDECFGKLIDKVSQVIDALQGGDLSDKPNGTKDASPQGKRRLPQDNNIDLDVDTSMEEAVVENREMDKDIAPKGVKRPFDGVDSHDVNKRPFAVPKTSTPSAPRERELSPFPVSFLNKFTLQPEKRSSDKEKEVSSPSKIKEQINRKLSFEDDRRDILLASDRDSSDSEDHRPRAGATYSRFDRVLQSFRKTTSVQTDVGLFDRKNQAVQTDGTNQSDLYSTLSNLFNCLCTQLGIHGSIVIDGIGRFEINLTKAALNNSNKAAKDQPSVSLLVDKSQQTEEGAVQSSSTENRATNTSQVVSKEIETQTSDARNPIIRPASPSPPNLIYSLESQHDLQEEEPLEEDQEEEEDEILNGDSLDPVDDNFTNIETSQEPASISQIVKEFSGGPVNNSTSIEKNGYDDPNSIQTEKTLGGEGDTTEIHSKAGSEFKKGLTELSSDDEDGKEKKKSQESDSQIVLESDEDDKFLMSCVFDTLENNDDLDSITSTPMSSPLKGDEKQKSDAHKGKTIETDNKEHEKRAPGNKVSPRI